MLKNLYLSIYSNLTQHEGGIESWLLKFLRMRAFLKSSYSKIYVIGIASSEKDLIEKEIDDPFVSFNYIKTNNKNSFVKYISYLRNINKWFYLNIETTRTNDIISVGTIYPTIPIFTNKKIANSQNCKKIIWLRSVLPRQLNLLFLRYFKNIILPLEKKYLEKSDLVIANGNDTKIRYCNYYKLKEDKIIVIPNAVIAGTIIENKKTLQSKKIKIAYIGRFFINKGINEFINSIELFNTQNPENNIEFFFIGFGKEEDKVLKLTQKYNNVFYRGKLANDEVLKELSKIDATVHLSFQSKNGGGGGVSNALLESIYSNNLIIAFDNMAYNQIITNKNGFLINEDNPAELVDVYNHISTEKENCLNRLKEASKLKVKYNFESHMLNFLENVNNIK